MSRLGHKLPLYSCVVIALAYLANKAELAFQFWFNGMNTWAKLFRPFPDWGECREQYGALFAAKWIGTRNMWYAGLLLALFFFILLFKRYKFMAFLLFQGALIELLDLFWLANGKYRSGWSTPNTNTAMITNLLWVAALLVCGFYLLKVHSTKARDPIEARSNPGD